jgi:surface protein
MKQKLILLAIALQMFINVPILANDDTYYSDFNYAYKGVFYKVNFTEREAYADGLADSRNLTDVNIQGFTMKGSDIYAIKKIATNVKLEMGGETVDPDKTYTFATTMVRQGFKGSGVTSVQMENSVTTIMADAFMSCAGLKSIQLSSGISEIPQNCFKGCSKLSAITIPANIKSIGYEAFRACSSLSTVSLSYGLQTIAEGAFDSCSGLASIELPNSVSEVGAGAFIDCRSLESVTISDNLKQIATTTFLGCEKLSAVVFGENSQLEKIGMMAFADCNSLKEFNMPDKLKTLESSNMGSSPFGKSAYDYTGDPIEKLKISDAISASSLSTMMSEIKGTLTTVTFGKKPTLKNLDILKGCERLQSVEIPASITSLSAKTFYYAQNLKEINSNIESPFTITDDVFNSNTYNTATLHVPVGSKSKYQATAGWKNFKEINETSGGDIIVPDEDGTPEPYAALSDDNKTLTFYYDGKKKSRNGMGVGPFSEDVDFDTWTVTISTEWYDQRESISTVEFDASFANYTGLTSTAYWFYDCSNLKDIKGLRNLNTSNVIYMNRMFSNCSVLKSLDVSNFNTSKVISMGSLFSGCSGLTSLDVSNFNIANVTDMEYMFSGCSGLTSLDVSNFNTTNVTYLSRSMSSMFSGCSGLTNINLSNFNTACVISMDNMFSGCSSLTNIDVSNFKVSTLTELGGMFYGCSALTTIYCDDTWSCSYAYMGGSMFNGCEMLKGAISFDSSKTDITYANPTTGYFTKKDMGTHIIASINTDKILIEVARKQRWIASDATQMTIADAESVKDLGSAFRSNPNIYFLDELKYFTGLTEITGFAFQDCSHLQHISIPSSVTSISFYAFSKCCALSSIVIPNSVTSIGACAFENCDDLTDITIPENVTKIGGYAFSECGSLRRIKVDTKNMYYDSRNDCDAIIETSSNTLIVGCKNTVIPTSVTAIADGAFWGCGDLSSVTIPGCLTSIGYASFKDCNSLPSICIPNSVNSIGEKAFDGCNSMTSVIVEKNTPLMINDNTFSNRANAVLYVPKGSAEAYSKADYWKEFKEIVEIEVDDTELKDGDTFTAKTVEGVDMTFKVISASEKTCQVGTGNAISIDMDYSGSITIPETVNGCKVTTVAFEAFSSSRISSVIIGNNVSKIDQNAFVSCQRLISVTFPNNDGFSLGYHPFQNCTSLETITLPKNLTSMDNNPFMGCSSLTSIGVEEDNPNFKSVDGVVYSKDTKAIYAYPCNRQSTVYEIIDGTQVIGNGAFISASKLEKVHIPNSVSQIYDSAFMNCSNLNKLILPPDITYIPQYLALFSGITEVLIPNKVTSINKYAFYCCNSLTTVRVEIEEPLDIDEFTFDNQANTNLYVPKGCVDAYSKAEYWKEFKNILEMDGGDDESVLKDGDTFTAKTVEGVEMTFKVISASDKTCQLGDGMKACIDRATSGCFTIPAEINGFKVISVASWALYNCYGLSEIVISEGVESLMDNSIEQCNGVTSFVLPASVTSLSNTFGGVSSCMKSIKVAEGNPVYDSRNNCNAIIETATNVLRDGCVNTIIPSTVTAIGDWAMCNKNLTSISIPSSVKSIGEGALRYNLFKTITIPESIENVSILAFEECWYLEKVTIVSKKCKLEGAAFANCGMLKTVVSYIEKPETVINNIFYNSYDRATKEYILNDNVELYVPFGTNTLYKNTNGWKNFKNIVELNATVGDVTGDGVVTKEDITEVETEILEPSEDFDPNKDVNRDGVVNVADIVKSNNIRNSQRQVR